MESKSSIADTTTPPSLLLKPGLLDERLSFVETENISSPTCVRPVLWFGSCRINEKGYYRINGGPRRGQYLHRAVWEHISGKSLPPGWHVHHQDFDKRHCCGLNLIAMPPEFNTSPSKRCPHTGQYISREEYIERLGYTYSL